MGGVNPGRAALALGDAGMDPRTWVAKAEVTAYTLDAETGALADVLVLLPNGESWPDTARVGAAYAGDGFGLHFPLRVGDEVYVELEAGDPDNGLVVTARVHSAAAKPPDEFTADGGPVLVVEKDKPLRIITLGGQVHIEARDGGDVLVEAGGDVEVHADGDALVDANGDAALQAGGDATVDATGRVAVGAGSTVEITAGTNAVVDGSSIRLGAGAAMGVARMGDTVAVTVGGVPGTGTITSASAKTTCE